MNKIKTVLDKVVSALVGIKGIQAVVLGGSRARGTHSPESDIDIGIYYDKETLNLVSLNKAAKNVDDEHRDNLVVPPGEWGKWVNGGGWLVIDGYHVDFILRDVDRVKNVIAECQEGNISAHYQIGHPHAYMNVMYMGELAVCKVLWEKQSNISELKSIAEQYPTKLKKAIIGFFGFEAAFSSMLAESNAEKNDVYYVIAHIVRAISALNQVLFAVNEEYCLNEKKAVGMIDNFNIHPLDYKDKINSIFTAAGTEGANACAQLKRLINEVKDILPKD
ncbi:nucleotidyltransferase domain-containing protein [Desulfotomaculum copahuensis]|uniref:DNA polymerase subunit beta n=1 Tax=Desulfotomaculum copahuensis TaxID=1838280 RepID=A0A1B7LIF9_9FIRM|nr:nucleotidyltransferase domain-containing protein [Desulfotomaculum copahuensis]OAT86360.1 DNA polymerase subunit beta [Desulfotomaculum copahuensis]